MNSALVLSSPFECTYSRASSSTWPKTFVSASMFAWKRAASAALSAGIRESSLASAAPDRTDVTNIKTRGGVMRRVFMQVSLGRSGRGCYDATRSPIDQTLSERPSLNEGAEGASFRPETLRQKNGRV